MTRNSTADAGPEPAADKARDVGLSSGLISGTTVATILRRVRDSAGESGVQLLLERAGERRPLELLDDAAQWSRYDAVVALFEAAVEVTGEEGFARRCGEDMVRQWESSEVAELLRSLGSPGEVLRNIALATPKFSTAWASEALEIGDDFAVTATWALDRPARHPALCSYTAGLISSAPVLFGMDPATVTETSCQGRGDDRCIYEARWDPGTSPDADLQRRVAHLESQLGVLAERFEALQATARELATVDGVDASLAAIARRAGAAVRAPRYVLAVDMGAGGLRLHHHGFPNEHEAHEVAEELLAETPAARHESWLVVDVVSGDRHFGRLAALYPDGVRFFPAERTLLEAYAANAGTALNVVSALDEARRQNRTARALLDLASSLAEGGNSREVAERLAQAIPAVVGCVHAAVLLWDREERCLRYQGMSGYREDVERRLRRMALGEHDLPDFDQLRSRPEPRIVGIETANRNVRELLRVAGVSHACVVPLVAGGEFYGLVAAPMEDPAGDLDLFERLRGMAQQAATALRNARLHEQIRHQALHDSLTGLPNRALLADRAERALVVNRRNPATAALLFVDLDNFKRVNDTLGHGVGDGLLQSVARRLQHTLRVADSVARVGGDEFVVLLPELGPAQTVTGIAEKLLFALRLPFTVAGHTLRISASIGTAVAERDDTFETLLSRADMTMYEAKAGGRDRIAHAA
ncbi:MAG: diguanylate cyclase [Actinobacteria bacterium]|nr:diguanylate cyclase [Actinomycetota bacterium]